MIPSGAGLYSFEILMPRHERDGFTSGVAGLDTYLQQQARQDQERGVAAVYILTANGTAIAGFYTLSSASILASDLPERVRKKLPRYPIPVTLLGRMAVHRLLQGQGLGKVLLFDALERARLSSYQVASWAVIVDAKEGARDFYLRYDFAALPAQPQRLFLPMRNIERFGF